MHNAVERVIEHLVPYHLGVWTEARLEVGSFLSVVFSRGAIPLVMHIGRRT